jgi:hypothetical protein
MDAQDHRSTNKLTRVAKSHKVLISACPWSVGQVSMLTLSFESADEALAAVKAIHDYNEEEHPNYCQTAIYLGGSTDPEDILPSIY